MKKLLLTLLIALSLATGAESRDRRVPIAAAGGGAGIAFVTSASTATDAANAVTLSYTVAAGTDRFLRCAPTWRGVTGITVTGITFNSVAMTQIASAHKEVSEGFTNFFGTDQWGLVAPSVGTFNVVVTLSADADLAFVGCDNWTGVHQTTPAGTAVTAEGTTETPSVTVTVGTGEVAVAVIACYDVAGFGTGDTQSWQRIASHASLGSYSLSTGSVVMDFTGVFAGGSSSAMSGVNLKPAP